MLLEKREIKKKSLKGL